MSNTQTATRSSSFCWTVFVAVAVLTAGCDGGGQLPVTAVYQSRQCGDQSPGLSRLEGAQALSAIVRANAVIDADGEPATPLPRTGQDNGLLFLISQGQRPTAGYTVRLQARQASVQNGTLILPLDFSSPPPNAIVAQVLTSPCLVVSVPPGDYERVVAGPFELTLTNAP